jgi:hypothetical protein
VPTPLVVGALSLVLLGVRPLLGAFSPVGPEPNGWLPTAIAFGAIVVSLVLMGRWSRRRGWGGRHVLAAAAGGLLGVAGAAFLVGPLGDVAAARSTPPTPSCSPSCCCWRRWRRGRSGSTASRRPAASSRSGSRPRRHPRPLRVAR